MAAIKPKRNKVAARAKTGASKAQHPKPHILYVSTSASDIIEALHISEEQQAAAERALHPGKAVAQKA